MQRLHIRPIVRKWMIRILIFDWRSIFWSNRKLQGSESVDGMNTQWTNWALLSRLCCSLHIIGIARATEASLLCLACYPTFVIRSPIPQGNATLHLFTCSAFFQKYSAVYESCKSVLRVAERCTNLYLTNNSAWGNWDITFTSVWITGPEGQKTLDTG